MAVGLDTAGSPESPPRAALAAAASRADGSRCRRTPGRTLAARAAHRLAAAALAVFSLAATAERLTLDGSQALEHPLFLYGNGHFTTPDGASVARDRAVDWWLVPARAGAAAAPAAGQDDPVVTRRLREYRERGRQMAAEFPGVSGVQILDDGEYELTADRRHVYRYHFAGLILNEQLLEWGDIALGFSEGRSPMRRL